MLFTIHDPSSIQINIQIFSLFDIRLGFIVIKGTHFESLKTFGLGTLKVLEKYLNFTTQTLQWAHFAKFR